MTGDARRSRASETELVTQVVAGQVLEHVDQRLAWFDDVNVLVADLFHPDIAADRGVDAAGLRPLDVAQRDDAGQFLLLLYRQVADAELRQHRFGAAHVTVYFDGVK